MNTKLTELWPPFGLRIAIQQGEYALELRGMNDEDLTEIATVGPEDIYGPNIPAHAFPWVFGDPDERIRASMKFRWANRAGFTPDSWSFDLVAISNDIIIGSTDLRATDFTTRKTVATGSWVRYSEQGRGYGTLIRHAIAIFCFDYLGATTIESGWMTDNYSSAKVSEKLGYEVTQATQLPAGPTAALRPAVLAQLSAQRYQDVKPTNISVEVRGYTQQLQQLLGVQTTA